MFPKYTLEDQLNKVLRAKYIFSNNKEINVFIFKIDLKVISFKNVKIKIDQN